MGSNNLIKNVISSLVLKIVSLIYGFIVPALIIKHYGSSINGLVSSITQFLSYIVLLEVGIGPVIKNALFKPLVEKNKDKIENILGTANHFFRQIAYIFIAYIVVLCIVYPFVINKEYSNFYIISLILTISISRFAEYFLGMTYKLFLQSDGKTYIIEYIYTITYIIDIIIIYILIKCNLSIQIIKLVCSLIYLIRPLFMKYYFDKKYQYKIKNKSNYNLDKKWDALSHHIAATIQENTDIIILTIFSSLNNVSIYSVYALVITGIRAIIYSFVSGLDAFFGKLMVHENNEVVVKKFQSYNFIYYTISTILLACTMILIIPFINVYTLNIHDANYIYPLFGYILVFAEFNFIIRYPYSTITFAKGHFKETRLVSIFEPIVNIILSVSLVAKFGLVGVAIGTFFSLLIRSIGFIVHTTKNILKINLLKSTSIIFVSGLELLTVLFIKIKFLNIDISSYLNWFIYAILVFVIVSIFIILLNCLLYRERSKEIYSMLLNKLKRKKQN